MLGLEEALAIICPHLLNEEIKTHHSKAYSTQITGWMKTLSLLMALPASGFHVQ